MAKSFSFKVVRQLRPMTITGVVIPAPVFAMAGPGDPPAPGQGV